MAKDTKLNQKPTSDDFTYAYTEGENGEILRVPKEQILAMGKDGGYYTPSVDENGNLTWTPSAESMSAIQGANIKGLDGEKGDPGEKGEKGDPGETGETGKSAYEYAKEGGYTGSESEFAAKLAADAVSVTYDADTKTLNISSGGGDI